MSIRSGLPILLASLLTALPAAAEVVVLRDGSRLRLEGAPVRRGDEVVLRLARSGLVVRVAAAAIDAEATERANREPEASAGAPTFTWGSAPDGSAAPPPPVDGERREISERYGERLAVLLQRQQELRVEARRLQQELDKVDRDLRTYYPYPQMRSGLGARRSEVLKSLESVGDRQRQVDDAVEGLFLAAAARGVPVPQREPPPAP